MTVASDRAAAYCEMFDGMAVVNHHEHIGWQFRDWADRDIDLPMWISHGYVRDDLVASDFRRDILDDKKWTYLHRDSGEPSRTAERMAEISAHLDHLYIADAIMREHFFCHLSTTQSGANRDLTVFVEFAF